MSGHTAGKWFPKQYPDGKWGVRNQLFAIANMVENGDEDEANARLIAAAPETKKDLEMVSEHAAELQNRIESIMIAAGIDSGNSYCAGGTEFAIRNKINSIKEERDELMEAAKNFLEAVTLGNSCLTDRIGPAKFKLKAAIDKAEGK